MARTARTPPRELFLPEGFQDVLFTLARNVLRARPQNIYSFCAAHFEALVRERDYVGGTDMSTRDDGKNNDGLFHGEVTKEETGIETHLASYEDGDFFKLTFSVNGSFTKNALQNNKANPWEKSVGPNEAISESEQEVGQNNGSSSPASFLGTIHLPMTGTSSSNAATQGERKPATTTTTVRLNGKVHDEVLSRLFNDEESCSSAQALQEDVLKPSIEHFPKPPNLPTPRPPWSHSWTALQLSRLAGRRTLRRQLELAHNGRAPLQPAIQTPMGHRPIGKAFTTSKPALPVLGRQEPRDCGAPEPSLGDSDDLSDTEIDSPWCEDSLDPRLVKRVRPRKKKRRTRSLGGRRCPTFQVIRVYDSYSSKTLHATFFSQSY